MRGTQSVRRFCTGFSDYTALGTATEDHELYDNVVLV